MKIPQEGCLLRVFLGESDQCDSRPLYESIVLKAREMHLAGSTVLRAVMGYGASSRLHTAKLLRLSEDMPIIVEIVDSRENVERILPFIDEHMEHGLVTMERAEVIWYR